MSPVCWLLCSTTVLFKVWDCKIKNIFFIFCLFLMYYLCEKYEPLMIQYYIADCVTWANFVGSVLITQLWPTLCDHIDCSPPGSSVHGFFSRLEYWSGLPFPSPGDIPNSGIERRSPALQADSLLAELRGNVVGLMNKLNLRMNSWNGACSYVEDLL